MTGRSFFIIVLSLFTVGVVGAQNLVSNSGFDTADQLDGWSCDTTYGTATWIPDDRLGAPSSGAMQHFVTAATNNQTVTCNYCVGIQELDAYRLGAWHYWPDDPDVVQDGTLRLFFQYYSDPGCTAFLSPATVKAGYHQAPDTWYWTETADAVAPAGAQSARLFVATWQDIADDWVRTRIDDIDFRTTTIFRDGFETADPYGWTGVYP